MQYEGYVVTPQPFEEANLGTVKEVYEDKELACLLASSPTNHFVSKVNLTLSQPFINDPSDPFVDIGKFRSILPPTDFMALVQKQSDNLVNTNEWERINGRHPHISLMELYRQFPDELDKLPVYADVIYGENNVHNALLSHGFDGAIHAVHGPYPGAIAYHTFHPARINFIEKVEL